MKELDTIDAEQYQVACCRDSVYRVSNRSICQKLISIVILAWYVTNVRIYTHNFTKKISIIIYLFFFFYSTCIYPKYTIVSINHRATWKFIQIDIDQPLQRKRSSILVSSELYISKFRYNTNSLYSSFFFCILFQQRVWRFIGRARTIEFWRWISRRQSSWNIKKCFGKSCIEWQLQIEPICYGLRKF